MLEKYIDAEEGFDIEVELDIDEDVQTYPWLYSLFIEGRLEDASKEEVISVVEKKPFVKYVGMRFIEGWSELYFYSMNSKDIQKEINSYLQTNSYKFEGGVIKDTKWEFYRGNLEPSELEFFMIESQKIVDMLVEEGDDISKKREVEHYVMFDTQTQLERFIDASKAEGFEFKDEISSDECEHGVALTKLHDLEYKTLLENISTLLSLSNKEHGSYELWSTTLAEDN
jgi:regulator of RNase E activity RraB